MRLPRMPGLIFNKVIDVVITSGIDENGSPQVISQKTYMCHFDETSKVRYGENATITLTGIALIEGDIAPELVKVSGYVMVGETRLTIYNAKRIRDGFGNVHHTELELI